MMLHPFMIGKLQLEFSW